MHVDLTAGFWDTHTSKTHPRPRFADHDSSRVYYMAIAGIMISRSSMLGHLFRIFGGSPPLIQLQTAPCSRSTGFFASIQRLLSNAVAATGNQSVRWCHHRTILTCRLSSGQASILRERHIILPQGYLVVLILYSQPMAGELTSMHDMNRVTGSTAMLGKNPC